MLRPLMQHGVGQLQELFAKSRSDAKVLKQLEVELQHRQVPWALALLAEVQAAMNGAKDIGASASVSPPVSPSAPPRQEDLWTAPAPLAVLVSTPPAPMPVAVPGLGAASAAAPRPACAVSTMTVDDA